jgi:beta-lactamase regulating signal transducer with metallopeptidase domain
MVPTISGVILAVGSSLAFLIVVKMTVVAVLGLAAAWLARRNSAAVRHALLAAMFGAALLLPIASIVSPSVHVAVPVVGVNRAALPLMIGTIEPILPVATAADGAAATAITPPASRFSLSALLLAGWIVGTAVFLLPLMTGLWQIRSLRRRGLPWLHGQSIAGNLALEAGIHRRVEVLLHEALQGPITCGVLHPAIVLPRDAESWARDDVSRALVHELEHVRRGDSATRCFARVACALYWFHPLAWIAWRKLVLEAERSCDDAVLGRSEATAYADQLVGLAKRLPTAPSPLLAMANRSDLAARITAVLDDRQRRGRAGRFSLVFACVGAVVVVIAMSEFRGGFGKAYRSGYHAPRPRGTPTRRRKVRGPY